MRCNLVQHGAKSWKIVQDGQGGARQGGAWWWKPVQCHAAPYNTIWYHAIPRKLCHTMHIRHCPAILCNTVQYHVILCSALQYSATPCYTVQYQYHQQLLTAMIWWRLKLIMFVLFGNDGNNHLIINDWRVMIILMLISWYGQWSSSESMWLVKRWW